MSGGDSERLRGIAKHLEMMRLSSAYKPSIEEVADLRRIADKLDALEAEVKRLKLELFAAVGDPEGCQICGELQPLLEVPNCDPSVGYHDTIQVCQDCIDKRKHASPCGSCG